MAAGDVFGVIVAGRLVRTDFVQLKETEYVIELPDPDRINHIAVFLTGLQPLPPAFGASIYVSWPSQQSEESASDWTYLGFISNEKPSAIFRIGQLNKTAQTRSLFGTMQMSTNSVNGPKSAVLGIMLESAESIQIRTKGAEEAAEQIQTSSMEFAQKILRNFVNFVQSFAVTLPKPADQPGQMPTMEEYVPAKAVTSWFNNFQTKLQMNPNFWRSLP